MMEPSFRRLLAGVVLTIACAAPALAAESVVDGPRARFEDDLVSRLEGRWSLVRTIRGREVRNTVVARWVLNHQFLQVHMKDVADPPAYEAIVHVGFLHSEKRYVAFWLDTYGGKFAAPAKGMRTGNSIEFRFEYPDGPFFNTFTWDPAAGRWVMRLESQAADGTRALFAVDTLTREEAPADARPEPK